MHPERFYYTVYRGFTILEVTSKSYIVKEYPATTFRTLEVAKKCIDVMLKAKPEIEIKDEKKIKNERPLW